MRIPPVVLLALTIAGPAHAIPTLVSESRSVYVDFFAARQDSDEQLWWTRSQSPSLPFSGFAGNVSETFLGMTGTAIQNSTITPYHIHADGWAWGTADSIAHSEDSPSYDAMVNVLSQFTVTFSLVRPVSYDLSGVNWGWGYAASVVWLHSANGDFSFGNGVDYYSRSGVLGPGVYTLEVFANGGTSCIVPLGPDQWYGEGGEYEMDLRLKEIPETGSTGVFVVMALVGLVVLRRRMTIPRP